jgi:hypothetical protein
MLNADRRTPEIMQKIQTAKNISKNTENMSKCGTKYNVTRSVLCIFQLQRVNVCVVQQNRLAGNLLIKVHIIIDNMLYSIARFLPYLAPKT